MTKYYIGLSVTYHDPALAIMNEQGEVLFAQATERYMQNKRALHCVADPLLWVRGILEQHCPSPTQFVIAINWRKKRPVYENMMAALGGLTAAGLLKAGIKKLHSPLSNYQLHHMMASQRNSIQSAGINLVRVIGEHYPQCTVSFVDYPHHLTHAASACYSSPFTDAACAVIDSFGENGSTAFYYFKNQQLTCLYEAKGTGSIGFYYMKITELCGFDWLQGEEWKVMGLAAYGKLNPALYQLLKTTISVQGFKCQHRSKNLFTSLETLKKFQRHKTDDAKQAADLAFTGQYFFAELMTHLLRHLQQVTGCKRLVLGGGCALNSSYNGQIKQRTNFQQVFIPCAPADDGTALGAAWLACAAQQPHSHSFKPATHNHNDWFSPFLGDTISNQSVQQMMQCSGNNKGLNIQHLPDTICEKTAELLATNYLVGWIQGRAEFGPRALGHRCILADPRMQQTKDRINRSIKFRENFRPFAPSVLHEYAGQYFENYHESPYMDKTLIIRPSMRQKIGAVCHVDGSSRLQSVKQEWSPLFYQLIRCFYQHTQIPMLLNTSLNVMGKPLVHSLEDALCLLLTTDLDVLVVNDYLISKSRTDWWPLHY